MIESMILPKEWSHEIKKAGIKKSDPDKLFNDGSSSTKAVATIPVYKSNFLDEDRMKYNERQRISDDVTLGHEMKSMGYNLSLNNK